MTIVDLAERRPTARTVLEGVVLEKGHPFAPRDLTGTDGPLAAVLPGVFTRPAQYGEADALAVTARLVKALAAAGQALAVAGDLYREAWQHRADRALGYDSWDVYVEERLGNLEALRIPKDVRREIVATLHAVKMPLRKMGRALGVDEGTVRGDVKHLKAQAALGAPEPALALASAPEPVAASAIDRALTALYAAGERGLTAPELGRLLRDVVDPGALLSVAHRYARVRRLSVQEDSGTREHQGRSFAVYLAAVDGPGKCPEPVDFTMGRQVEGPGRRRARR